MEAREDVAKQRCHIEVGGIAFNEDVLQDAWRMSEGVEEEVTGIEKLVAQGKEAGANLSEGGLRRRGGV